MAAKAPKSVEDYLAALPADRRAALEQVRATILRHLPAGLEEGVQYGMIGYFVPLARYPDTYNGQPLNLAALASQKHHMALYLTSIYMDPETQAWFEQEYRATGKRYDVGKSCVRFRSLDDLPLELVGRAIARIPLDAFLARYEAVRARSPGRKPASARAVRGKAVRASAARSSAGRARSARARR